MHRLFSALIPLAMVTLLAGADESAKKKGKDGLNALIEELKGKLPTAKGVEDREQLFTDFAPRFLQHAKDNAKDESAVEALALILTIPFKDNGKDGPRAQAFKLLQGYAKSPLIEGVLKQLAAGVEKEQHELVLKVAQEHPEKLTRVLAYRALIKGKESAQRMNQQLDSNPKFLAAYEKLRGADYIAKVRETAKTADDDIKTYRAAVEKDLKDVLPEIKVGAKAPETIGTDLAGKSVKLSDHKGKVVVLDFWATWCGPCIKMIPESRKLVKEMDGKPFVLIGVSVDGKADTVKQFQEKHEMPWVHWHIGPNGKALDLWDVSAFPTLFVIDHKGIIQHTQVGFDPAKDSVPEKVAELVRAAEEAKKDKTE